MNGGRSKPTRTPSVALRRKVTIQKGRSHMVLFSIFQSLFEGLLLLISFVLTGGFPFR